MYELKNYNETVVQLALAEFVRNSDLPCTCDRCLADIASLVLNQLPPKYCVSLRGEIITNVESQTLPSQARIISEIVQAAKQVASSPNHT